MSWYTESDGTIIVSDDCDHSRDHIGFQMGTIRRLEDGKLVLLDTDLLSMCGPHVKAPSDTRGRPADEDVDGLLIASRKAAKLIGHGKIGHGCPQDKKKCRFWNDVFGVCSIARRWRAKEREDAPCAREKRMTSGRATGSPSPAYEGRHDGAE